MKPGSIIKHKRFLDVSFLVSSISEKREVLHITGNWIILGKIEHEQTLIVKWSELLNWEDVRQVLIEMKEVA